jgi:hypothetical protein
MELTLTDTSVSIWLPKLWKDSPRFWKKFTNSISVPNNLPNPIDIENSYLQQKLKEYNGRLIIHSKPIDNNHIYEIKFISLYDLLHFKLVWL